MTSAPKPRDDVRRLPGPGALLRLAGDDAYIRAEVDPSEPAGLAGGYLREPGTVGLISMFVRPRARGRGVGEALINVVIDWARARNATSVHLWVTETNKHARLLYERCGFSPTGERQPLPSKPGIAEVAMTRRL